MDDLRPSGRFARAIADFDAANAEDPRRMVVDGVERPQQLVHAERVSAWVEQLVPDASEALRLAARCQHLKRWQFPRDEYPEGREGYLKWRRALAKYHADEAEKILQAAGYDDDTVSQVRRINLKQGIKRDPEVQTMEDALCLTFLQYEAAEFATRHELDKVVNILRKTWVKMSPRGHEAALRVTLPDPLPAALEAATKG